jgi:prevent-host-death family protein
MLTRNRNAGKKPSPSGVWKLQDAKARFSELVRRAQSEGPQRVTVHGKDAVVVVSAGEYAKAPLHGDKPATGQLLIDAMQQGRKLGLRLKPLRYYPAYRPPVRFEDDK